MSNSQEQEDAMLAASLANESRNFFNNQFQGNSRQKLSGMLPTNIVDPRTVVNRDFGQRGQQYSQPYQPPQQQQYYPPNVPQQYQNDQGSFTPYGQAIPDAIPLQPVKQLMVPVGKNPDGSLIMGDPSVLLSPTVSQQNDGGLQTVGFQLPQFGNAPNVPVANSGNSISNEDFQILMKELKSMKKSINKLTKAFENAKLIPDEHITVNVIQPVTEDDLENTD